MKESDEEVELGPGLGRITAPIGTRVARLPDTAGLV